MNMLVRTVAVEYNTLSVVRLADRRTQSHAMQEWCYQKKLEEVLFANGFGRSTGAMNKLLARSTAGTAPNLMLKRSSIDAGLVTHEEFQWLVDHLHDSVRSFTLVPLTSVEAALDTLGANPRAKALAAALGLARPTSWGPSSSEEDNEEECEEEDQEEEEEEGEGEDEEQEVDGEDGEDGDDGEDGEDGEGDEGDEGEDGEEGDSGESGGVGDTPSDGEVSVAPTEDMVDDEPPTTEDAPAKRQRCVVKYALSETPQLTTQLDDFARHRAAPILSTRSSVAVTAATYRTDRGCALRLMGWLDSMGKLPTPPSLLVFASPKIVEVIEAFVKKHCSSDLARGKVRSYKWAVNHIGSFLAIVRYVGTLTQVQPAVLTRLGALHKQTLQQSRLQSKFAIANAPAAWLEWPAVLQARVSAERAVAAYKGSDLRRQATLTRNVLLMRLHSDQPPDRVGVLRTLQLGSTLCKRNGVWMLSLSEPELHKTSKLFGAQTTELNASVVEWLDRYLELTSIPNGGYLFHAKSDVTEPLSPQGWTRLVQSIYFKHANVRMCPKDLRASYITFLRSADVDDDLVRATATAMRHSSATASVRALLQRNQRCHYMFETRPYAHDSRSLQPTIRMARSRWSTAR
jgi:hypothetical protein